MWPAENNSARCDLQKECLFFLSFARPVFAEREREQRRVRKQPESLTLPQDGAAAVFWARPSQCLHNRCASSPPLPRGPTQSRARHVLHAFRCDREDAGFHCSAFGHLQVGRLLSLCEPPRAFTSAGTVYLLRVGCRHTLSTHSSVSCLTNQVFSQLGCFCLWLLS